MLLAEFYKRRGSAPARPPSRHSHLVRCIQPPCASSPPLVLRSSSPLRHVTPGGRDYLGISASRRSVLLRDRAASSLLSGGPWDFLNPSSPVLPLWAFAFVRGYTRRDLIDGTRSAGLSGLPSSFELEKFARRLFSDVPFGKFSPQR